MRKALQALLWYNKQRKVKTQAYEKAKSDRKRIQSQKTLFKLMQVAAYWRRKTFEGDALMLATHADLKTKAAFAKWRNMIVRR